MPTRKIIDPVSALLGRRPPLSRPWKACAADDTGDTNTTLTAAQAEAHEQRLLAEEARVQAELEALLGREEMARNRAIAAAVASRRARTKKPKARAS